jgi:regulator of replication initiation timing
MAYCKEAEQRGFLFAKIPELEAEVNELRRQSAEAKQRLQQQQGCAEKLVMLLKDLRQEKSHDVISKAKVDPGAVLGILKWGTMFLLQFWEMGGDCDFESFSEAK